MRHRVAAKNRNGLCDIIECNQRQTTIQLDRIFECIDYRTDRTQNGSAPGEC